MSVHCSAHCTQVRALFSALHTGQCTVLRTDLHRTGHLALALTALDTELALVAYLELAAQRLP